MSSTFFGLQLSQRALNAQQLALDVTGNNISNANTTGYSRQLPVLTASTPYTIQTVGRSLTLGSGTDLNTITRARDAFVDSQYRQESSSQSYWGAQETNLNQVQDILNEPTDDSLSNDMTQFWTAWSDLSNDPENEGARSVVSERAQELADSFHNIAGQVTTQEQNMDSSIKVQINQINTYAQQISDLNNQIKQAQVAGNNPNDLMDQRDNIVDQLSQIVNVKVVETKDPAFTDRDVTDYKVIIGNDSSSMNNVLVNGSAYRLLQDPPPTDATTGFAQVVWSDDPSETPVDLGTNSGSLQADLETRDSYLPGFMAQIDTLAQAVSDSVNAIHRTGQGLVAETGVDGSGNPIGINFFTDGTSTPALDANGLPVVTAATININTDILNDVDRIATGKLNSTVNSGDGSIAQDISALSSGWSNLGTLLSANPVSGTSLGDYYSSVVAKMGVDVQQATRMKAGQDVLVDNLSNQRQSLSGVSLDEEMTNLVQYQKSYAAAARMVTMMDSMFDSLLSMGVTK